MLNGSLPTMPDAPCPGTTATRPIVPFSHLQMSKPPRARSKAHPGSGVTAIRLAGFAGDGEVEICSRGNPYDVLAISPAGPEPLVMQGRGKLTQRGPHGPIFSLLPAEIAYTARYATTVQSLSLALPAGRLAALINANRTATLDPLFSNADNQIVALVELVGAEVEDPGFASDLLIDGATRAIAALIARHLSSDLPDGGDRVSLTPVRLRRVTDYVEAHLDETLTIDDLARTAGLSMHHFAHVFRKATGLSPYRYLMARRLQRARNLLADDRASLAEIAKSCGFADQAHFTRAFCKATGQAPGRFRRAMAR